jgi:hypothetical protein
MPNARVAVAALATVPAVALTACGGSSSSTSSSPTSASASKATFCRTFDRLGTDTSPRNAAGELSRVGTPSDVSADARHGFDVLVDHLRDLPAKTQPRAITQMVQGLSSGDMSDVRAFITYYGTECQDVPGDSSS